MVVVHLHRTESLIGQGCVDGTEHITYLGPENAHNSDHNDGDEYKNNCIFDKALTFFLRGKQHRQIPFKIKNLGNNPRLLPFYLFSQYLREFVGNGLYVFGRIPIPTLNIINEGNCYNKEHS